MIQCYILSILYLLLSALLFLQNRYRVQLSFFLRLSSFLRENRKALGIFVASGFLLVFVLALLPLSPGPMVLGDLIPLLMITYDSLYFLIVFSRDEGESRKDYLDIGKESRKVFLGYLNIAVAVLHFIFPTFVLL